MSLFKYIFCMITAMYLFALPCNIVKHTIKQKLINTRVRLSEKKKKKCWTMLKTMFDGNQTSFNIIQHRATWWPNVQPDEFNNVGDVAPFSRTFCSPV